MAEWFDRLAEDCTTAAHAVRKRFPLILVAPFAEFAFFITLGFATAPIFDRIILYAQQYFGALAQQAPQAIAGALPVTPALRMLVLLELALLIVVYLLYTILQGITWGVCARTITGVPLATFLRKFALANLVWVPMYGIIHLLSLVADYQQLAAARLSMSAPRFLTLVVLVLTLALLYFATTDYALRAIGKTHRIRKSIRLFPRLIPHIVLIAAAFLLINAALMLAFGISATAALIGGALVVLPLFSYARMVWLAAVKHNV